MKDREALTQTLVEPAEGLADLDKIMANIRQILSGEKAKPSVADLMHLLELQRELAQGQPGPMTVRWIDECPQTPACEE